MMIDRDREIEGDLDVPARALMEQVRSSAAAAREQLDEGRKRVREYVMEKPVQALGIALGVGVLIGWLIKRR
jgi:ElaB/YqjD/DUF883 family membrane-anchored ribosome-binding protein